MLRRLGRLMCALKAVPLGELQPTTPKIPVHLVPYNPAKYEVPAKRIKRHSGYSALQVDPMPRATIMKIAYNFLERMKQAPQGVYYRLYNEQRTKWIMRIVDQNEDIQQLELALGTDSIELFIQGYITQFKNIDHWLQVKPWQVTNEGEEELDYEESAKFKKDLARDPRYQRGPRQQTDFL